MTLALLKVLANGAPLSAIQHDGNFSAIENEVNAKVSTTDPRLSDARAPLTHSQAISTITGLQAELDAKALGATVSALTTTVGSKVDTGDSRMTNRRGVATGDYGGIIADAGGVVALTPAGTVAAITGTTVPQAAAIVAALQTPILEVVTGAPFPDATLLQFATGTDDTVYPSAAAARHLGRRTAKTYAATVTLNLDCKRTLDSDATNSDTLITTIACTGACTVNLANINAALIRQGGEIVFTRTSGTGAAALATGGGVTVTYDTGVTSPGLGTTAGNTLEIVYVITSTTAVRIESARAYTA